MQAVEQKAGFSFQRIGAPQPIDIVKAGAKDAARSGGVVKGCGLAGSGCVNVVRSLGGNG